MADDSFKKVFLDSHNAFRKNHSTPPLTMSTELNNTCQEWANHLLSKNQLSHSTTNDGENVFFASSSDQIKLSGSEAVDSWYGEIKDYDWSKPGFGSNTGHFTQVVWKDSKELGVGYATNGKTAFVVGQYRPAGNMLPEANFEKNVLPKADGTNDTPTTTSGTSSDGKGKSKTRCILL